MGLDMYLEGERYYSNISNDDVRPKLGDYPIKQNILDMGYWRKHPDLHGYIVQKYGGEDIAKAIEEDRLAHNTEGFFFGSSENHIMHLKEDAKVFRDAKAWIESFRESERWCVAVKYQASW